MKSVAVILRLIAGLKSFQSLTSGMASPTRLLSSFVRAIKYIFNFLNSLRNFGLKSHFFLRPQNQYTAIDRNCREHAVAYSLRLIFQFHRSACLARQWGWAKAVVSYKCLRSAGR
jgi:hypothetical protein